LPTSHYILEILGRHIALMGESGCIKVGLFSAKLCSLISLI